MANNPVLAAALVDELITPEEFERDYKVAIATQASMRSRGLIPHINLSKRMPRYRRSAIEAWLAAREVNGVK